MDNILTEFERSEDSYAKIQKLIGLLIYVLIIDFGVLLGSYYNSIGFSEISFTEYTDYIFPLATLILIIGNYLLIKRKLSGWLLLLFFLVIASGLFLKTMILIITGTNNMIPVWRFAILTIMSLDSIAIIILMFNKRITNGISISKPFFFTWLVLCILLFLISYMTIY